MPEARREGSRETRARARGCCCCGWERRRRVGGQVAAEERREHIWSLCDEVLVLLLLQNYAALACHEGAERRRVVGRFRLATG